MWADEAGEDLEGAISLVTGIVEFGLGLADVILEGEWGGYETASLFVDALSTIAGGMVASAESEEKEQLWDLIEITLQIASVVLNWLNFAGYDEGWDLKCWSMLVGSISHSLNLIPSLINLLDLKITEWGQYTQGAVALVISIILIGNTVSGILKLLYLDSVFEKDNDD